ncbi:MAG: hypothetical protein H6707_19360 [Deltaproteobacteria bacterium]|nr:hypothetical protein [Deltaproteobacteria bacterium]
MIGAQHTKTAVLAILLFGSIGGTAQATPTVERLSLTRVSLVERRDAPLPIDALELDGGQLSTVRPTLGLINPLLGGALRAAVDRGTLARMYLGLAKQTLGWGIARITFATLSAAVVIWGIADAIINPRKMRSTLPAVAVGPVGATREGQLIYGAAMVLRL